MSNQPDWNPDLVRQVQSKLFSRAAKDKAFRKLCLEDARAAIEEISGRQLPPEAPKIRFLEQREELLFVLPPLTEGDSELSDQDLEAVAGGTTLTNLYGSWGKVGDPLPEGQISVDQQQF